MFQPPLMRGVAIFGLKQSGLADAQSADDETQAYQGPDQNVDPDRRLDTKLQRDRSGDDGCADHQCEQRSWSVTDIERGKVEATGRASGRKFNQARKKRSGPTFWAAPGQCCQCACGHQARPTHQGSGFISNGAKLGPGAENCALKVKAGSASTLIRLSATKKGSTRGSPGGATSRPTLICARCQPPVTSRCGPARPNRPKHRPRRTGIATRRQRNASTKRRLRSQNAGVA